MHLEVICLVKVELRWGLLAYNVVLGVTFQGAWWYHISDPNKAN